MTKGFFLDTNTTSKKCSIGRKLRSIPVQYDLHFGMEHFTLDSIEGTRFEIQHT